MQSLPKQRQGSNRLHRSEVPTDGTIARPVARSRPDYRQLLSYACSARIVSGLATIRAETIRQVIEGVPFAGKAPGSRVKFVNTAIFSA